MDPLDESGHRLRIEAHHAAGDRAGAVRAYHECAATLERELGVEPGDATTGVYTAVLDDGRGGRVAGRWLRRGRAGAGGPRRRVGSSWWRRGRPPGSGGRRSCSWRVSRASARPGSSRRCGRGAWRRARATGEARSYATECDLGYGVVTSWLRSPDVRTRLGRLPPHERAELARLLPELGGPETAGRRRRRAPRSASLDAVAAAIAGGCAPTLLIADDVSGASTGSARNSSSRPPCWFASPSIDPLLAVLDGVERRARERSPPDGAAATPWRSRAGSSTSALIGFRASRPERREPVAGAPLDERVVDVLFAEHRGQPLSSSRCSGAGWDGLDRVLPVEPASGRADRAASTACPRSRPLSSACSGPSWAARAAEPARRGLRPGRTGPGGPRPRRAVAAGHPLRDRQTTRHDFSHGKLREAAYDALEARRSAGRTTVRSPRRSPTWQGGTRRWREPGGRALRGGDLCRRRGGLGCSVLAFEPSTSTRRRVRAGRSTGRSPGRSSDSTSADDASSSRCPRFRVSTPGSTATARPHGRAHRVGRGRTGLDLGVDLEPSFSALDGHVGAVPRRLRRLADAACPPARARRRPPATTGCPSSAAI